MCTFIETPDVRVLLDPGASLGPSRFGFPPHPREYKALRDCRRKIAEAAEKAEVVTISHYHFDHHTPSYTDWFLHWSSEETARQIYEGKTILAKSYREKVNYNQRRRGWVFAQTSGRHAEKLEFADGKVFAFNDTKIRFSEPVFHGPGDSELGWLIMATIEHEDERVLFASDVQGPMHTPTVKTILQQNPDVVIVGGPPTYLAELVQEEHIQQGMQNLEKIVQNVPTTILEHHLLRDENWWTLAHSVLDMALKAGYQVFTAADFLRRENALLEAHRKQLYETEQPSPEFEKWMRIPLSKRTGTPPPI